ncbi:DEAD/DEAH box helicase [Magnetovirga frankeli]|uniref:DEAD/DEAH box helicase n=1 Tax=Magnetovirga frankeli TaxID=947516 RepID=UPI00129364EF|nr:DEAD/DEAH box helicase [gamma proteobacterium SS-5]
MNNEQPNQHLSNVHFDSFGLKTEINNGLRDAGFDLCTPIQALAIPLALQGKDLAGQAQTGTGKTAAFMLPLLERLLSVEAKGNNQPRALIVAPTRELVFQIHKDAELLGRHTGLRIGVVFGGADYDRQREMVSAGLDILIGTPGRLIDFFKQHIYNLKSIEVLVLDEADRMFDLGFIKDIRYLLRRMPPPQERLGMLFSATLSYRVKELAYEHMNNPQDVIVETDSITADRIQETAYMVANEEKIPLLLGLMQHKGMSRTIVFVNTKRVADRVWGFLEGNGFPTAILSGDVPQKKRMSLLKKFQDGEVAVLVATDVAARGLHIPAVSHVINYDLPEDSEDYVHRIGRTARAGASGDAISFVCETYAFSLPEIEDYVQHKIPVNPVNPELLAKVDPKSMIKTDRPPPRGRSGGNRSGGNRRGPPRR